VFVKYCSTCIIPYSRPNIAFDENGRCNCATRETKSAVNWVERAQLFRAVAEHAQSRARFYDCLIPVSGGKDSTWQVVTCLEHGLRPLCVTWRPPGRTALGQRNLDNLIRLGVDHIDYSINPKVEKKLTYAALVRYGTPALPMHMALFSIPLTIAVKFDIPLVVWGENSAFEYGGTEDARRGFRLDSAWLKQYGVTHGTTARDWIGADLTDKDLVPYFRPTDAELADKEILAIFLGYYFPWDPETSFRVAKEHGFIKRSEGARTGYWNYADLDDDFISIHHWLKWYKFGFTRTYDNLSIEIRTGRMTRDQAIEIVRRRGDETPHADIEKFCGWLGITRDHFFEVIERFRNPSIWTKKGGKWIIDDFLIPDWNW
jgi:N-acetyl sugar amidotransferase